jgi:hypothetical protein
MANKSLRLKYDIKDFISSYKLHVDPELKELIESNSISEEITSKLQNVWLRLETNRAVYLKQAILNCRFEIDEKWEQCLFDEASKANLTFYFNLPESEF